MYPITSPSMLAPRLRVCGQQAGLGRCQGLQSSSCSGGPAPSLLHQPRAGEGSLQGDKGNLGKLVVLGAGTAWAAHSGVSGNKEALFDHREAPISPVHGSLMSLLPFVMHTA